MDAANLVKDTLDGLRALALAAEQNGAELAKDGHYSEALDKYQEVEDARAGYDQMSDYRTFDRIVGQFPALSAMPREPEECGIPETFVLPESIPPSGYSESAIPVMNAARLALRLVATNPNGDFHRTRIAHTHNFLSDATDLRTTIAAIPRWIVAAMQEAGVVGKWQCVIGHHGRVYATISPRRACEILSGDVAAFDATCMNAFTNLRAICDARLAQEDARKEVRNRKARDRRAKKIAEGSASTAAN